MLIKFGFFTVIYLLFSWIIADDFICALEGDPLCLQNVAVRYMIFMILMIGYETIVKQKLFKKKTK